jgi:very-short-patch-repair endonuclease
VGHNIPAVRLTELRVRGPDHLIAAIAGEQYGVVSRRQLLDVGLGPGAVHSRVRRLGLHPLHRGVYAVGHPALVPLAREMAALLAYGPGAVISHRSAGALWRIVGPDGLDNAPVDLTLPRGAGRSRAGVRVHRARRLAQDDVRLLQRIPLTAPCRTLLDLAEVVNVRELESAYCEAIVRRLVSEAALRRTLRNSEGRRGIGPLTMLLDGQAGLSLTRSQAEENMLALVRDAGLPTPQVNIRVHGHLVDFLWRRERVVVEVDGYRFHSSRVAFERDRVRDAELEEAGLWVIRVTWRQLTERPFGVVARLARALAAGQRVSLRAPQ